MARLAVNIDHVATIREARGIDEPDPVLAAGMAELAGADDEALTDSLARIQRAGNPELCRDERFNATERLQA